MDIELRHLRVVCAIADAGSITRAAARTGTTQPALTATLQRIERAWGGRLFARSREGVTLTAFGESVLPLARGVLASANALDHHVRGWLTDGSARPIALGGIGGSMVVELAGRLGERLGSAMVAVSTEFSPRRLLDLLAAARLDAAVVADYPDHELVGPPGVRLRALAVEPIFVALPSAHPAAAADEVRLADLAADEWVLGPSDGVGWPECFESVCERAGFRPRVMHRISDPSLLRRLVAAGRALSPCQVTFPEAPGIAVRPLAGDPLWLRYLVAWRDRGAFGKQAEVLITEAMSAYEHDTERSATYHRWLAARSDSDMMGA
ncbi:LysR substrate-binding domain-containing protein [Amycolatopsis lurida]